MDLKIFKIKKHFKKGGIHINPDIYWGLSLFITMLVIITSFIFSYFLLQDLNKKFVSPAPNISQQVHVIGKDRIDKVLEYFSARKKKSEEIINSRPPVIDPSL